MEKKITTAIGLVIVTLWLATAWMLAESRRDFDDIIAMISTPDITDEETTPLNFDVWPDETVQTAGTADPYCCCRCLILDATANKLTQTPPPCGKEK